MKAGLKVGLKAGVKVGLKVWLKSWSKGWPARQGGGRFGGIEGHQGRTGEHLGCEHGALPVVRAQGRGAHDGHDGEADAGAHDQR